MFKVFFLFEKRRWDLVGCSWKNVERWSPNHRGRVSSDSSPWPEIETALESKVQNIEKLQMQSSVIVAIGVSNSLVNMTSSPKPQLFKSERCETQSHIVHWLRSSIFTCLFVCLVVRPVSMVTSTYISTLWCSRPNKEMVDMDMMDMDMVDTNMVDRVDIFQGCIFFEGEYFSGANIFQG